MNECDIKLEMNRFINGGPGSGNPNPGQGRGVGKPSTGISKTSKSSYDEYISKMGQYVKSKGKTSIDMTKTWSVEDAAKKYLEKADVSVKDFDDIYQLNVDYKNYSSSSPISKESKEKFKKDFSKAIVDAQEQIFGVDSSSALISTPDIRKYVDDVKSKIEKELDLK